MSSNSLSSIIYIFDPQSEQYIPYRPDYAGGIPVSDFNMIQQQRMSKQRAPIRDNQLGIIVPLITIQPRQSDWQQLASIARRYPRVNTVAIVSPSLDTRGLELGSGPDGELSNAIAFLQNSSVIVLGYIMINNNSGSRTDQTLETQKAVIDSWRNWYPSINGLYFDIGNMKNVGYQRLVDDIEALASYAKVDKGFRYIFANLAATTDGGVVNTSQDYVEQMKGVDTFIIYERDGYPVDAWYASIKKDWMAKYPRSKFAFVVYSVGPETLACRNFIDKCVGIEKVGGYVYVQGGGTSLVDRRKMREMSNLSPLTEVCMMQLDNQATTESIPSVRGVQPQGSTVVDTQNEGGLSGRTTTTTDSTQESPGSVTARQDMEFDKFGVRKIYPTKRKEKKTLKRQRDEQRADEEERKASSGGYYYHPNEWYIFAENPRADANFKNLPDRLIKQDDGSWTTADEDENQQVRLEAWNPQNQDKWLNVEITGYFKALNMPPTKTTKYLIQQYARGGHHHKDMKKWCEGSAYKGRLMTNGMVGVVKEVHHNAYTGNRGLTQATTTDLENRWIGMKTIIYNYTKMLPKSQGGKYNTFVGMEIWIDDNVTDENGNLVVRNDWKHIMTMQDEGGWFASDLYTKKANRGFRKDKCPRLNLDNAKAKEKSKRQFRQRDEIITMPGGTENRNCVAWRWDNAKVAFKHLSAREITKVQAD